MTRQTRPISWIKAALKEFETFPEGARSICLAVLTIAAEAGKADVAKPIPRIGFATSALPASAAIVKTARQIDLAPSGNVSNSFSAALIHEMGRVCRVIGALALLRPPYTVMLSYMTTLCQGNLSCSRYLPIRFTWFPASPRIATLTRREGAPR